MVDGRLLTGAKERRSDASCRGGEHGADEERNVVAAEERGQGTVVGTQAVGPRGGDAREDGETERSPHHERGVDDARSEARLLRRNVAHGGEQDRIEGDART